MGGQTQQGRGEARRRRLAERERELSELATRQHGVVSRGQALDAGLTTRMIERRLASGRLHLLHRGVYAVGHRRLSVRSRWMAAVLACGDGAVLSHRSAAALWGLMRPRSDPIEISARTARIRRGRRPPTLRVHRGRLDSDDKAVVAAIPVTSVARTLLDLADVIDAERVDKAFQDADRLGLVEMRALEDVCARGRGRRGLKILGRLIAEARAPEPARTTLEARMLELCRQYGLPAPETNVTVLGREVDAFWPSYGVMVEADSWAFHHHRAAFEDDRARDTAMQAEGYRVLRITHRRMKDEPAQVAEELRRVLVQSGAGALKRPHGGSSAARSEQGQGAVEWVGLLAVIALLFMALTAASVRVPGASLASAVGSKLLCAAALADHCGEEPVLIAA
jgi:predicted transcriptional regulator of viral defense system